MHRFYMHHSFTKFHRNVSICEQKLTVAMHKTFISAIYLLAQVISPTTLFLAAKVEEQPRKLEHVIKVAHACLNPQEPPLDTKSNVSSAGGLKCLDLPRLSWNSRCFCGSCFLHVPGCVK